MNTGNDALNLFEGDYTITEFRFTNGEKLPELRIHYRTVGKSAVVSGKIQNAVLLLHGTSGTGAAFLAGKFILIPASQQTIGRILECSHRKVANSSVLQCSYNLR